MRTIAVALAILSACFMQEVSGAFLSVTSKKEEAKVELKEEPVLDASALRGMSSHDLDAAAQQLGARAEELITKAKQAGASNDAKKAAIQAAKNFNAADTALQAREGQGEEQEAEQGESLNSLFKGLGGTGDEQQEEEHSEYDQGEEQEAEQGESLNSLLKGLGEEADEQGDEQGDEQEGEDNYDDEDNYGDEQEYEQGDEQGDEKEYDQSDFENMSEDDYSDALLNLQAKSTKLAAVADKDGASEEDRLAADQAENEVSEAMEANVGKQGIDEIALIQETKDLDLLGAQAVMALLHKAEELSDEALKDGASDEAKKAAAQAEKEFHEADAMELSRRASRSKGV